MNIGSLRFVRDPHGTPSLSKSNAFLYYAGLAVFMEVHDVIVLESTLQSALQS